MERIIILVTEEQKVQINKTCEELKISKSEYIRSLLPKPDHDHVVATSTPGENANIPDHDHATIDPVELALRKLKIT
jgi:hypothetical protein